MKHKLFTPEEIKIIDSTALKEISLKDLISEVAASLGEWFLKNIPKEESLSILCGPGNNGNDGRALNEYLNAKGYTSRSVDLEYLEVEEVKESLVVDSVFGISLDRELPERLKKFIKLNEGKKVISIDVPSGVKADTGEVLGCSFKSDITLTIGALKVGLFLFPGREASGEIISIPIQSLNKHFDNFDAEFVSLDVEDTGSFPKTTPLDHKYTKGVASFVMSEKYPGASILAAKAAVSAGSGYIKVFVPNSLIKNSQLTYPDFVFEPYESEKDLVKKILEDQRIDSLCIGTGWDFNTESFLPLFKDFQKDLVVDGGAMSVDVLKALKEKKNVVFTPHSGEQKRVLGGENKVLVMKSFCESYKGVLVSKGYDTLIGQNGQKKVLTLFNSTKLSVAGTGDVLAGLITGLMARGLSAYEAALMAQRLQFLGAKSSVQRMSASDLIDSIKDLRLEND